MFYSFIKNLSSSKNRGSRDFVPCEFDYQHPHAEGNLDDEEFPSFIPKFSPLVLTAKSPRTDVISDGGAIGGIGFIVSKRLREILESFNLMPHRFYALETFHKGERIEDYYWMQLIRINTFEWIDYSKSDFTIENGIGAFEDITINNAAEMKDASMTYNGFIAQLRVKNVVLNNLYLKNPLDFFLFDRIVYGAIISESLKNRLEKEKITGLEKFNLHSITTQNG